MIENKELFLMVKNPHKKNVNTGVPQDSNLGPLFFLIYINDLSGDLSSKVKLFVDDTSLFAVGHNVNTVSG